LNSIVIFSKEGLQRSAKDADFVCQAEVDFSVRYHKHIVNHKEG